MKTLNKIKSKLNHSKAKDTAETVLQEGTEQAQHISEETLHALQEAGESVKQYSSELANKAKKRPVTTTLVLVGVGCLLAALLNKR